MSGDILQTPDAPKSQGALDNYFKSKFFVK